MMLPDIVILAGGKGTRLQSVVSDLPKPMAPVAGKPFLSYLLNFLERKGAQKIILATGYLHASIESYFGNRFGSVTLDYSVEAEPLGTGGAIKKALSKCQSDQILVYNGDTLFLGDPATLLEFHNKMGKDITIALKPMFNPYRYGTVVLSKDLITSFKEKDPYLSEGVINTGVYCVSKDIFDQETRLKFSFEQDILEPFSKKERISGLITDAYFIDIGIPEDYEKANQSFGNLVY